MKEILTKKIAGELRDMIREWCKSNPSSNFLEFAECLHELISDIRYITSDEAIVRILADYLDRLDPRRKTTSILDETFTEWEKKTY